jgi:hypothetical protein
MRKPSRSRFSTALVANVVAALVVSTGARADEGGVPFWFSGQYASMAAVPPTPGWTVTLMPYYYSGSADRSRTFPKGNALVANLESHLGLMNAQLSYAWDTKVFGGIPSLGMSWGVGNNGTSASVLATLASSHPYGPISGSVTGDSDLYPIATLSWSKDNDNWMTYLTGDIPVGAYNSQRLSNIGIGHGAIDAGGGYTYLNQKTGLEFSAVAGLTYNLKNSDTNYRNGVDSHVDWAVSQFLSQSWQVGVVGYAYYQLTNDSYTTEGPLGLLRQGALGGFKSRVASVGPEVGYVFKMGKQTGYFNLRGYWEFWAQNRLKGYAVFATVNLPLGN